MLAVDEDQSTSSLLQDSSFVSETSQKKRKKSKKSSSNVSDGSSLDSNDRSRGSQEDNNLWNDIFAPCKVMVCMQLRNLKRSKSMITHAEDEFFQNFEADADSALPLPLEGLFGKGTVRRVVHDLEMSILSGKNTFQSLNLYTANGSPLSCHISVVCINGNRNRVSPEVRTIGAFEEKYAVLTIRSASVIGNAKQNGIGFFGPRHKIAGVDSDDENSSSNGRKRARRDSF